MMLLHIFRRSYDSIDKLGDQEWPMGIYRLHNRIYPGSPGNNIRSSQILAYVIDKPTDLDNGLRIA